MSNEVVAEAVEDTAVEVEVEEIVVGVEVEGTAVMGEVAVDIVEEGEGHGGGTVKSSSQTTKGKSFMTCQKKLSR